MKVYLCIALAVMVEICSAAFILGSSGGSRGYSGPPIHQKVQTFQVIQQQGSTIGQGSSGVEFIKVFSPPPQEKRIKFIQQPQSREPKYVNIIQEQHMKYTQFVREPQQPVEKFKTIEVVHKHPAENIKTIQIIREQPINTDAAGRGGNLDSGYAGDAFETLKSLKVFGAFKGNGNVVDSYGLPIVNTWRGII